MKNLCLSFLLAVTCLFILIACKDDDNPTPPPVTPKIDSVLWEVNINMEELVKAKFTDDGSKIVVISESNLHLLDAATGQVLLSKIQPLGPGTRILHMDIVNEFVFISGYNNIIHKYRISDLNFMWGDTLDHHIRYLYYDKYHNQLLLNITLDEDGKFSELRRYTVSPEFIDSYTFSGSNFFLNTDEDNLYYCSAYWQADHWEYYIKKRNFNNLNDQIKFGTHYEVVEDLAVSPDNKYLASCDIIGNIFIWDNTTNKKYKEFKEEEGASISFLKNNYLCFPGTHSTKVINFQTNQILRTYNQFCSSSIDFFNEKNQILLVGHFGVTLIQNDYLEDK